MKISSYIFELLQSHDCVIVPNFGALVARNISAKISSDGSKIFPPNKELSFTTRAPNPFNDEHLGMLLGRT